MISFAMIMFDKLRDGVSKVALADRNDPIEAFVFNRSDETHRDTQEANARSVAMASETLSGGRIDFEIVHPSSSAKSSDCRNVSVSRSRALVRSCLIAHSSSLISCSQCGQMNETSIGARC
jgi:hypothetical protein